MSKSAWPANQPNVGLVVSPTGVTHRRHWRPKPGAPGADRGAVAGRGAGAREKEARGEIESAHPDYLGGSRPDKSAASADQWHLRTLSSHYSVGVLCYCVPQEAVHELGEGAGGPGRLAGRVQSDTPVLGQVLLRQTPLQTFRDSLSLEREKMLDGS